VNRLMKTSWDFGSCQGIDIYRLRNDSLGDRS
jgi:hypothetical protein